MRSPSNSPEAEQWKVTGGEVLASCFRVTSAAGSGTCFLVGEGYHLLTAKHVVCAGDEPLSDVVVHIGEVAITPLIIPIPSYDVALLRVDEQIHGTSLPIVTLVSGRDGYVASHTGIPEGIAPRYLADCAHQRPPAERLLRDRVSHTFPCTSRGIKWCAGTRLGKQRHWRFRLAYSRGAGPRYIRREQSLLPAARFLSPASWNPPRDGFHR